MALYPTKPSFKHPPRHTILGGYVIDNDTCLAWGSRLRGREGFFYPLEQIDSAVCVIKMWLMKEYKTKFTGVGEDFDSGDWMVVTQSAKFNGWKDMDPALIPQFEEGYREEVARQLLAEHGT